MCQNCRSAVAPTVAQDCIPNKKQESLVSVNVTVEYRHVFLGAANFLLPFHTPVIDSSFGLQFRMLSVSVCQRQRY